MTLRSSYFAGRFTLPTLLAGTDTLSAVRVDDSTLSVTLPRRPSGVVAISVAHDGRSDSVAAVQLAGLRATRVLSPGLQEIGRAHV